MQIRSLLFSHFENFFSKGVFIKPTAYMLVFLLLFTFTVAPLVQAQVLGQQNGQATTTPNLPLVLDDATATSILESLLEQLNNSSTSLKSLLNEPKAGPNQELSNVSTSTPMAEANTETQTPTPTPEVKEEPKEPAITYGSLMREVASVKKGGSFASPAAVLLQAKLSQFIISETARLTESGMAEEKQANYLDLLKKQLDQITGGGEIVNLSPSPSGSSKADKVEADEIKIPVKPGSFDFADEPVKLQKLPSAVEVVEPNDPVASKIDQQTFIDGEPLADVASLPGKESSTSSPNVMSVFSIPEGMFGIQTIGDEDLPTLGDVGSDNGEIVINSTIQDLAASLENNPVKIYNFVRNAVEYEPYFGAKKGAMGCLVEKLCNDVDASSLTIALLRAAGIPARYHKNLAVISTDQLKNLLGVDDTKTVYAALFWNKVPVYVISDGASQTPDFNTFDFTQLTQLAVEWTYVDAFYEYDERGGNISNTLSFANVSSTAEIQAELALFPKKQWIPLDAVIKPYGRTKNIIVPDSANFNTQAFWTNYLVSQNSQAPLQKYTSDLLAASGKNIATSTYQSTRLPVVDELQILPPSLPYYIGISDSFNPEVWSQLPDSRKARVKITLKKDSDKSTVLERTFFGSEINNLPLNLFYKGATESDEAIIESFGGIHATPATLVDIVPYFDIFASSTAPVVPLKIGESLILQFEYTLSGQVEETNQKFSIAGNQEGIYVSLSKPLADPLIDDDPGKVLLEGNSALARVYLLRISNNLDAYKKALDVSVNTQFNRAVVTQNRVLNMVNGLPTTFDFKGLTLDASTFITSYSNRGNYTNRTKDLHLLFGLDASFHEGQIFNDIAGLDGISTVKGLQYAASQQSTYTIHNITQANESVIDTLQLSANTKQNMHADVLKGNTIITPNKLITKGNFTGILYISLRPDGTGTYAIGEQSQQNGGFTTVSFDLTMVYDPNTGVTQPRFKSAKPDEYFVFGDSILGNDTKCRIPSGTYNAVLATPGYLAEYGLPCRVDTKIFGPIAHTYYLLTDGAKFISQGRYDYWVRERLAKAVLETDKETDNVGGLHNIELNGLFKFDVTAGTYSYSGTHDYSEELVLYYQPANNNRGFGRPVYGNVLNKLSAPHFSHKTYLCPGDDNGCGGDYVHSILNKLGYPTSNRGVAATSPTGSNGEFQNFIGGDVYLKERGGFTGWFAGGHNTYYVPIQMMTGNDGYAGTGSGYGFPVEDPVYNENTLEIFQNFETGDIKAKFDNSYETTSTIQQVTFYSTDTSGAFLEGMHDGFVEIGSFAVIFRMSTTASLDEITTAASQMARLLAVKILPGSGAKIAVRFIPLVGWVIAGGLIAYSAVQLKPLIDACNSDRYTEGMPPKYYCGKLALYVATAVIGFVYEAGIRNINSLGVATQAGREGKNILFNSVANESQGQRLKSLFANNKNRTVLSETAKRIPSEDVKILLDQPDILSTVSSSAEANKTFNGFVKSGQVSPVSKFRVDPRFSSQSYGPGSQFATNHSTLVGKGLSKAGFYNGAIKQEVDQAINILKTKIGGTSKGEIIFVQKTNGGIVLTPRTYDIELPHPYLVAGDDVIAAGTIVPQENGALLITNSSGHYKPLKQSVKGVIDTFKSQGYSVQDGSQNF